jgi:hypothetical protein
MRRLFAALAVALLLAGFGAFHAVTPSASLQASASPNVPCNGTPSSC